MPKFLVCQRLPKGNNVVEDHLQPLADVVAQSLDDPDAATVVWLWGCADIEHDEWHMLFEGPDEAAVAAELRDLPGLSSINRVLYATPENFAYLLMRGMATRRVEENGSGLEGLDEETGSAARGAEAEG